jgi:hypothetical protein
MSKPKLPALAAYNRHGRHTFSHPATGPFKVIRCDVADPMRDELLGRIAELEAALDRITKRHYERTKVVWSDELVRDFDMRDSRCNRVTMELGERDEDGFYMPTLTTHYDDNPLAQAEAALAEMKGRRCGGCAHDKTCGVARVAWTQFGVQPFSCVCWTARAEEGSAK